jgi:hypothetical protein
MASYMVPIERSSDVSFLEDHIYLARREARISNPPLTEENGRGRYESG